MQAWPVSLHHEDITVRPLRIRDQVSWARVRSANAQWLEPWDATFPDTGNRPPTSFVSMVLSLRSQAREGRTMPFAITYQGDFVGQLTVSGIVMGAARWAEMGYWIDQNVAGRSIMPISVALVCDHLFTAKRLHRIQIAIRPENERSLRVVEKLGFTEIGYAPRYLHINGEWADHRLFQLLAEDAPLGVLTRYLSTR